MEPNAAVLFEPYQLGPLLLKNRIVMAPLTRNRAIHGIDVPQEMNVKYYSQRASAGLIISEATQISPSAKGYAWTPGMYSDEQVKGWRKVTDAVHAKGGAIFAQLWHVGRISHTSLQPNGQAPVAPSAIAAEKQRTFIETGAFAEVSTPRALDVSELPGIIEDYRRAAANAIRAGFDGIEIHGANGYLIHQFLSDGSNHRQDAYGGSVENRMRFPLAIVDAIINEIGADRTGIRLSPVSPVNAINHSDPKDVFFPFVKELSKRGLVYIHVVEGATGGSRESDLLDFHALRQCFNGAWMVNNGYTRDLAIEAISSHYADLVAFGKPFISNPDLVLRFKRNAPLNPFNPQLFYGGGEEGYTDYPFLPES